MKKGSTAPEYDIAGAVQRLDAARDFARQMADNPYNPMHCRKMFGQLADGIDAVVNKCLTPAGAQFTGGYAFVKPDPRAR